MRIRIKRKERRIWKTKVKAKKERNLRRKEGKKKE